MFLAPAPVVQRTLLSREEMDKIQGRIRGLKKLCKHPRMALKEMRATGNVLMLNLNALLLFGRMPYSEEAMKHLNNGKQFTIDLEDLIIRVVIRRESFEKLQTAMMKNQRAH